MACSGFGAVLVVGSSGSVTVLVLLGVLGSSGYGAVLVVVRSGYNFLGSTIIGQ